MEVVVVDVRGKRKDEPYLFHHVHATAFGTALASVKGRHLLTKHLDFRVPPLRNSPPLPHPTRTTRAPPPPATSPRVQQPLAHDGFSQTSRNPSPSPRRNGCNFWGGVGNKAGNYKATPRNLSTWEIDRMIDEAEKYKVDSIPSPDRLDHVLQFDHAPPPSRSRSVRIRSPHSSATSSAFSDSDSPRLRLANALQNGPAAPRAAPPQPPPRPGAPIGLECRLRRCQPRRERLQRGGGVAHAHVAVCPLVATGIATHARAGGMGGFGQQLQGQSGMGMGWGTRPPPGPRVPRRPLYTHRPSSPTPMLACHRFMRDTGWWYADLRGKGAGDGRGRTPRDALARARTPGDVPSPPSPVLRKSGSSASLLLCECAISGLTGDSGVSSAPPPPTYSLTPPPPPSSASSHTKQPLKSRNSRSLGAALPCLSVVPQQQSQAPSRQQPPVDSPQQQQQQRQDTDEWRHTAQARAILGNLIVPNGEQLTSTDPYSEVEVLCGVIEEESPARTAPPLPSTLCRSNTTLHSNSDERETRTPAPPTPSPPTPTWGGHPVTTPGSDANGPTLHPNCKSIDLPGLNTFAPQRAPEGSPVSRAGTDVEREQRERERERERHEQLYARHAHDHLQVHERCMPLVHPPPLLPRARARVPPLHARHGVVVRGLAQQGHGRREGQDVARRIGVGAGTGRRALPALAGVAQKRQLRLALAPRACRQRPVFLYCATVFLGS
ncbi:hypothetical protein B0H14DRAFT_3637419 [Mycena olivaceomarginata]|nr:hypothetical protein B0H14DRAFT_3637419 [Mycena olivaceomarginata]